MFLTVHSYLQLDFCNASAFTNINQNTCILQKKNHTKENQITWIKYMKSYILHGILLMISKVRLTAKVSLAALNTCITDVTVLLLSLFCMLLLK